MFVAPILPYMSLDGILTSAELADEKVIDIALRSQRLAMGTLCLVSAGFGLFVASVSLVGLRAIREDKHSDIPGKADVP
jgi:hypothetical protein